MQNAISLMHISKQGIRKPALHHNIKIPAETILKWKFIKELWLLVGAYFLYMLCRKLIFEDPESVAIQNAHTIISLERTLGISWEAPLQSFLINRSKALVIFLNWSYILTFFPVIIPVGICLYKLNRPKYIYYRNVILLSLIIGVMIYAIFPLAPPRIVPESTIVDTIQMYGPSHYNSREAQFYYNAFAAMPSIHFGWTAMFGLMFLGNNSIWSRSLGIIYPSLTLLAIIGTGNHYILDAAVGGLVITIALIINSLLIKNDIPLAPVSIILNVGCKMIRKPNQTT